MAPSLLIFLNSELTIMQEFNDLADDANIYKLVGPVLLKQDTTEAKSTVDGRLEYIGGEMYVYRSLQSFGDARLTRSQQTD